MFTKKRKTGRLNKVEDLRIMLKIGLGITQHLGTFKTGLSDIAKINHSLIRLHTLPCATGFFCSNSRVSCIFRTKAVDEPLTDRTRPDRQVFRGVAAKNGNSNDY